MRLLYRLFPPCRKCPYTLGQVQTFSYPCKLCKLSGYSAYKMFKGWLNREPDCEETEVNCVERNPEHDNRVDCRSGGSDRKGD